MFANGENQSVLAEQVRQRAMQTAALRAERDKATKHTVVVDGLRIAPGTRLAPADIGADSLLPDNIVPAGRQPLPDFALQGAAGPTGPAGMGQDAAFRDGKGVPPPAMNMRMGPKPGGKAGQPQTPAAHSRPSEQDINALIQASAQRAGRPNAE